MFSTISISSSKKKIMKTGSEYLFKYIKATPDKKNHLIEPMCCLIRLGILNFKDPGTKISIYDNSINYYEPNIIQGILRTWNGDNREDLHNLYNPIITALRWYYPSNVFYKSFLILARDGILKLKLVYEYNSIIHHTLNHYIRTIEDVLNKVDESTDIFTKQDIAYLKNLECDMDDFEKNVSRAGHSVYHSTIEDTENNTNDILIKNKKLSVNEKTNKIEKLKKLEKNEKNIKETISNKYNVRFEDESDKTEHESVCENLNKSTIKNEHINFIEIFRNLWTDNELTIISSTFNHLTNIKENKNIKDESQRRELIDTYLKSIEIIVAQKEKEVKNIIMSTISSY